MVSSSTPNNQIDEKIAQRFSNLKDGNNLIKGEKMKSNINLTLILVWGFLVFNSNGTFSQTKTKSDSTKHEMKKMECCKKGNANSIKCKERTDANNEDLSSVLQADKNKDGKVFIDGMCKDVIKDEPGNCPNCGMELKEVTIKQAEDFIKK